MLNRTKMIAAAATMAVALAAGSGAALAAGAGSKPGPSGSAHQKPGHGKAAPSSKSAEERHGHDAIVAAVAAELHLSTASVGTALAPIFAAGPADPSAPVFVAAARGIGVSTARLAAALATAKQSIANGS
jgi:hypothetical protein